ncbi:hypothetical protein FB451DRAFT_1387715 [Mycena latifolia]|nr:hypothetical protein FB451DRAFT_1387715 [Mycena latifolia]
MPAIVSATPPGSPPPRFSEPPLSPPPSPPPPDGSWTPCGSPPPTRAFSVPAADAPPLEDEGAPPVEVLGWQRGEVVVLARQKASARHHRKGEAKEKPGKESWVWGTKQKFFESRKDKWITMTEKNEAGAFYTRMARLYTLKYGYALGDNEDLATDIADLPDSEADKVVHEALAPEEAEARAKHFRKLRERIGAWYRHKYGSLVKSDKAAFAEIFTGVLNGAPPKPQRPRIQNYYSKKFYHSRIVDRFEARMASLKRRSERTGEKTPEALTVWRNVTREVWEEETPAFREEVEEALERDYKVAVKAWEASLADSPARTPEEMAATLDNAGFYLQPFVDAIKERFGMCATVLLAGPMLKHSGAIGMQSVHAGETRGLAPQIWPLHDKVGFREVEKRMIAFAGDCFSEAECRAHAGGSRVPPPPPRVPRDDNAVASGSGANAVASGSSTTNNGGNDRRDGDEIQPPPLRQVGWSYDEDDGWIFTDPPGVGEGSGGAGAAANASTAEGQNAGRAASAGSENAPTPAPTPNARSGAGVAPSADAASASGGADAAAGSSAGGGGGAGGMDGEGSAEEDAALQRRIDAVWQRDDRAEWTEELARAHAAFERGKTWGVGWASCVSDFFDFEAACGYEENGTKITTKKRLKAMGEWITQARKWENPMKIGKIGKDGEEGTYADDWWRWRKSLQPEEHEELGGY